jgi:flagellar basal-body rod modification protein FlgD
MTQPIAGTGTPQPTAAASSQGGNSGALMDPTQFLQLLVTQLENQDPLSPMDSSQFVQETSVLDEVTALQQVSTEMTSLLQTETTGEAVSLIGRSVTVTPAVGSSPVTGTVTAVTAGANGPEITVQGTAYPLSSVTGVTGTGGGGA